MELDAPTSQLHKGDVMSLIYAKIDGLDVLISGSADRTIKLWEPKNAVKASATAGGPKPQPSAGQSQSGGGGQAQAASACFQTIIGHGGSIIAMAFI